MSRRLLGVLLAAALLSVACGDDGAGETVDPGATTSTTTTEAPSDDTESTTTSAAPVELTASWRGVTEDMVRIGFTMSDLDRLRADGVVDINRGDPQVVVDALIADLNDRGGINGRVVEGHLEQVIPFDPIEAEAACVRLTEDIGVFAVVGPFDGPNTEVNPCLNDLNETILVGGQPTADHLARSKAPWISDTMSADRRLAGVVALMEEEGLLGDVVGVVVNDAEQAAGDDIVIPALRELGKEVVDVVATSASGDTLNAESQFALFIERWEEAGVDSVVLVENTATFGASELVQSTLDAQVLVVDSAFLIATLGTRGAVPLEDLAGVVGSSGASDEDAWELPATQECVRVVEERNPDIDVVAPWEVAEGEADWYTNIVRICSRFRLFELAATAAGPELTHDAFLAGAESLGEIELPGQVFASIGPGKHDANDAVRLMVFDPTVDADGGASPLGPLQRID